MKRLLTIIILILISTVAFSQEICDNAIDDDTDGLVDLNDPDCNCAQKIDIIPNPSFESRTCCPSAVNQMNCVDSWVQASDATSDYFNTCGYTGLLVSPQTPLPSAGDGYIGFKSDTIDYHKEYVGVCLTGPMLAGKSYSLSLNITWVNRFFPAATTELDFAVYGTPTCGDLPWAGNNCPIGIGNWTALSEETLTLTNINEWETVTLTFMPAVNINAIAIGGICDSGSTFFNYYYMDDLNLEASPETLNDSIGRTGSWCTNDLALTAYTDTFGGAWQWYKDGIALVGQISSNIDLSTNNFGVGLYTVKYTLGGNCYVDTINIANIPSDTATFSYADTNYCLTDTDPVPTISGTTGGTFSISAPGVIDVNSGLIDINGSDIGTFIVTYTTNGSCPDTDTFSIDISSCTPPVASYIVSDSTICETKCITIINSSKNATNYQWTFNGGTPSTSIAEGPHTICFSDPGIYTIELIASTSLRADTMSSTVKVFTSPTINAGNDETIQLGQSTTLFAIGAIGNYSWTPPMWLDCPTCLVPLATPKKTITYSLTVVDSNGCLASDSVTLIVDFDIAIFVPNIFSPNGDGNNDVLYVRGAGVESFKFMIYDRWGERVFSSEKLNIGWDGSFKGEAMNSGVFMYHLKAIFIDGTNAEQKGDVTLVR